jgi:hypothetical protein
LFADFTANVTKKHGDMEGKVVITVEGQQEVCTETFFVVDLDRPPQCGTEVPKPISNKPWSREFPRWAYREFLLIDLCASEKLHCIGTIYRHT